MPPKDRAEVRKSELPRRGRAAFGVLLFVGFLLVGAPAWGDVIRLDPPTGSVTTGGGSTTSEVAVELAAPDGAGSCVGTASLPEGVTVDFSPQCEQGSFTATMTVTVGESVEPGDYTIDTIQSCQGGDSEESSGEQTPGEETESEEPADETSCSGTSTFALKVQSDSGTPSVSPPPTVGPTPPDETDDPVQDLLDRMTRPGRILYNPPEEMEVGQTDTVEVRITRDPGAVLDEALTGSGPPVEEDVPVASEMLVDLVGPDFEITPLSPRRQVVGGEGFNEWAFQIEPQRGGELFLRLTVSLELDGKKVQGVKPRVLQRTIKVDVDPLYSVTRFVGDNWQPVLLTTVAVATLLFGSGILVARRKEEAAGRATGRGGPAPRPRVGLRFRRNRPRT